MVFAKEYARFALFGNSNDAIDFAVETADCQGLSKMFGGRIQFTAVIGIFTDIKRLAFGQYHQPLIYWRFGP
jgi:hypothetical protein